MAITEVAVQSPFGNATSAAPSSQAGDIAILAYRGTVASAPSGWVELSSGAGYGVYVQELTGSLGAETWSGASVVALIIYRDAALPNSISWGSDGGLVAPSIDTASNSLALSVGIAGLNHGSMTFVKPAAYTHRAGQSSGTYRVNISSRDMASGGATGTGTWTTNGSGSFFKVGTLEVAEPAPAEQHESGGSTSNIDASAEGAGAAWHVVARSEPAIASVGPTFPWLGSGSRPWLSPEAEVYLGVART